jgi:hypothetical protein
MNRFSRLGAVRRGSCVPFVLLLAACSGSDATGLLGDSGTQPDVSIVDAGAQETSTQNDAATEDVNVQDAVADVTLDLNIGPADSRIQCGPSITCSAQQQACCWHMGNNTTPFECVTDVSSCNGTYDVPMTCSTPDNCASQGNPSYSCCATGGNFGMGSQCEGYDVATVVACKSSCAITDYQVGCSVKSQNCSDTTQTCVVSKCTVPDDTFCE